MLKAVAIQSVFLSIGVEQYKIMARRRTTSKNKKPSLSEEATGGGGVDASASAIPDSEQKTKRKGSVSGTGASGGGKAEKKSGIFGRKKAIVTPVDTPSERTLSVSSEPPAQSPKRPEDEPESRNDSVSDVEEKRVMQAQSSVKSKTLGKTDNVSPEPGAFQRLKTQYLRMLEEKMQLLDKLEKRDNQLKALREEKLAKGEESTANYPDVMRSLSVGDAQSPADPRAEVDRLRGVLDDREKKIHNLQVQLNSFQQVASGNATLEEQIVQLKGKLEASEVHVMIIIMFIIIIYFIERNQKIEGRV